MFAPCVPQRYRFDFKYSAARSTMWRQSLAIAAPRHLSSGPEREDATQTKFRSRGPAPMARAAQIQACTAWAMVA